MIIRQRFDNLSAIPRPCGSPRQPSPPSYAGPLYPDGKRRSLQSTRLRRATRIA